MQTVILKIKAKPGAKATTFTVIDDEIKASLAAQPVDGEANKELLRSLAKALKLKQSQLELKVGATSKHKLIKITSDFSKEELIEKLKTR